MEKNFAQTGAMHGTGTSLPEDWDSCSDSCEINFDAGIRLPVHQYVEMS